MLGRKFTSSAGSNRPSTRTLRYHFVVSAIPMIGFGFIDNSIMLRAGDLIDQLIGDKFKLNTLTAAAYGQAISDVCGVLFGGTIAAFAASLGLHAAKFSESQRELRVVKMVGTAGMAVGVFAGCCLGMTNLLFMDLGSRERLKREKELKTIFQTVVDSSKDLLNAELSTIWLMNDGATELWTHASTNLGNKVLTLSVPKELISERLAGLTVTCAIKQETLNITDCYKDFRFDPSLDKQHDFKTNSMICVPVIGSEGQTLGVVQFINKKDKYGKSSPFSDADCKLARMMAHHVAIFIQQSRN